MAGAWGENTVEELADYIKKKLGGLSGFTRRGLYRMKQFHETYSSPDFFAAIGSPLDRYLKNDKSSKVSALPTLLINYSLLFINYSMILAYLVIPEAIMPLLMMLKLLR